MKRAFLLVPLLALTACNSIYYAAWEKHIAVYGWLGADAAVLAPLKSHVSSKGTLKFPIDADLPMADIVNLALHIAERCR